MRNMFETGLHILLSGCLQFGVFAPLVALGALPAGVLTVSLIIFLLFIFIGITMMERGY